MMMMMMMMMMLVMLVVLVIMRLQKDYLTISEIGTFLGKQHNQCRNFRVQPVSNGSTRELWDANPVGGVK